MPALSWPTLPNEVKLEVFDRLALTDVGNVSAINQHSRLLCLPILFKVIKLRSAESIAKFLHTVPSKYYTYIKELDITTKPEDPCYGGYGYGCPPPPAITTFLVRLLQDCTQLRQLSICAGGSLGVKLIPCFSQLTELKRLAISNWANEEQYPLSERVVVSLAYAAPSLQELSLSRITRSAMHAPELLGRVPRIPYVMHDDNIPSHPVLGNDLRLPALLYLPTLRKLRIRDSHLGDPLWCPDAWRLRASHSHSTTEPCSLEFLDLGCSPYENHDTNQLFTERILRSVPSTIESFTLGTALGSSRYSDLHSQSTYSDTQKTHLPRLRTLQLSPLVLPSFIHKTLVQPQLSYSPVHTISCAFHPDDGADGCEALSDFLVERRASLPDTTRPDSSSTSQVPRPQFPQLRRLSISITSKTPSDASGEDFGIVDDDMPGDGDDMPGDGVDMYPPGSAEAFEMAAERRASARRLRRLCRDLSLEVEIIGEDADDIDEGLSKPELPDTEFAQATPGDAISKGQRARAMST